MHVDNTAERIKMSEMNRFVGFPILDNGSFACMYTLTIFPYRFERIYFKHVEP